MGNSNNSSTNSDVEKSYNQYKKQFKLLNKDKNISSSNENPEQKLKHINAVTQECESLLAVCFQTFDFTEQIICQEKDELELVINDSERAKLSDITNEI
mmetsp:Transcript_41690/g.37104  ORF Transcript_41690/g.37104 Transcript_41690/m.37104 type:complete len:99 (-) Transcript_41690:2219-2515(-)